MGCVRPLLPMDGERGLIVLVEEVVHTLSGPVELLRFIPLFLTGFVYSRSGRHLLTQRLSLNSLTRSNIEHLLNWFF